MGEYTTIKVSRSIKERLETYARSRGLSLAAAVNQLLEEQRTALLLERIAALLEEQNRLLAEIRDVLRGREGAVVEVSPEPKLPSWMQDNPWLEILGRKGGGR